MATIPSLYVLQEIYTKLSLTFRKVRNKKDRHRLKCEILKELVLAHTKEGCNKL